MSRRVRRRGRRSALRTAVLAAAVAIVALLPLYGDTTPGDAVTHPEWARMLLRGLELLEDVGSGVTDTASMAFATLSGRDSRSWSADRYIRGNRIEVVSEGDTRLVRPTAVVGEAVYPLAVARGGDYHLRLHVAAPSPAEAEIAPFGEDEVLRTFAVPAEPVMGWVDAGTFHLDPGAYDTTVLLPEGAALEHVELAPPCLRPIEPPGGWQPTAITTLDDVAVTVLQALDMEYELAPAAAPLEYRGSDLQLEGGAETLEATASPLTEGSFRGGPRGARVLLEANIPEEGLYTLSVFGVTTGGQRWLADGCRKSIVCPAPEATPQWRVVLSTRLSPGLHYFEATFGPDTVIERIRFERKKDAPADYAGALARLGLTLGEEGPLTRAQAEEARRFLEQRREQQVRELCGDILAPGTLIAELTAAGVGGSGSGGGTGPGGGGPGGEGGGEGGGGGGGGNIPPPNIPPLPPASGTLPTAFGGD
jgi:hypothetical protein